MPAAASSCRLASASTVLIRAVSMRYFERKFSSVWAHASFCEGVVLAANASMKLASVDREKESRDKKGKDTDAAPISFR